MTPSPENYEQPNVDQFSLVCKGCQEEAKSLLGDYCLQCWKHRMPHKTKMPTIPWTMTFAARTGYYK